MPTLTLVLLSVVGFSLCYYVEERNPIFSPNIRTTPEKQVEILKRYVQFQDKQIIERWWMTEEMTCEEVNSVMVKLQENMKTDLSLLMNDAKKHLKQVPPPGNKRMRWCIAEIREKIEEAVQEGVGNFSKCTALYGYMQNEKKSEMEKRRDEYKKSIDYTLENMDRCLELSNKMSEVHRNRCVDQILKESLKQFRAAYDIFSQSECMSHFTHDILNCTSNVFNNTVAKKRELKKEINQCVGYSHFNPEQQNFGLAIKDILSNHMYLYKGLNNYYDQAIRSYFSSFPHWQLMGEEEFKQFHHDYEYLKPYLNTLNKTWEENRSKLDRTCYYEAIEKLNNLLNKGSEEFAECHQNSIQQRTEGVESFIKIVEEFNTKLREAGNVALLRCFGQRPQQIFNFNTIKECSDLARKGINWEWSKTQIKLSLLNNNLTQNQILPNDVTCGPLRVRKLILDADKILNECTRCLYGGSGDFYAVTTTPTNTTSTTSTYDQWTEYSSVPEMETEKSQIEVEM